MDCLFCKISAGQIPATIVHQDDDLVAFKDINGQAPLHLLIIPRRHISTLNDLSPADDGLVGSMFRTAAVLAAQHGYADRGYRTVLPDSTHSVPVLGSIGRGASGST
jgi:histidine triad (HIT) family protein